VISWDPPPDAAVVKVMTDRLAHRGPDAAGVEALAPVVLGHRRLSVIDVSETNNQPLFDVAHTVAIAFNGEIYNFREIRAELERSGAHFRTQGDTEVVVEAYKRWGDDCLLRFNGMFAFALWDIRRQRLLLARDRAGEKPLFYAELPGGGLAFASEPRALRAHPQVGREVDPIGLAHYMTLNYTLGRHTLLRGVRRLPPGHCLSLEAGRSPVLRRYWDLAAAFRDKTPFVSAADAAEQLLALMDDAVRIRLVSDVPLGAFLSGGVDSSAIAAAMARALPASQVHTFSMGFGEPSFDEVDSARAVAAHLGLDHKDEIIGSNVEKILQALVTAADEPLADTSVIPTYLLAEFSRGYVTVVLSGDGGDECFAGYETNVADRLHHVLGWLPGGLARGMSQVADALLPVTFSKVSLDYKIRHFLKALHLDFPRAHASWRNIFSPSERAEVMQSWWREVEGDVEADCFAEFEPHFAEVASCHFVDQASYVDIKTWLPDDILVKVDRATMAHSLEARAPLLDHRLIEFAASLPPEWKLRGLRKKHLFKESLRGRLPDWVLDRKKEGFNSPMTKWLAGPLRPLAQDALHSTALEEWVRPDAIERLWREQDARIRDNSLKLFGLICFSLWLNQL
jgi:asparagine synthase (glutamine-hydrolysing)